MKYFLLISLFFFGCAKDSSTTNGQNDAAIAAANSSTDGTWAYVAPSSTDSFVKGFGAKISDNKILLLGMYIYTQSSGYMVYFRRHEGTYIKEGEKLKITYTYETCKPTGGETIYMRADGNTATISNEDKSTIITVSRFKEDDPKSPLNMTMIEDKDCSIMAKIEKDLKSKNKRSIASDLNQNSIFSIFNLQRKK